ncbi:MAG TPA: PIN domain-containing protein [Bryobacteraceae bacterium]|jgi:predicted nucleic acid-binding protein|nr:PIN domain-containing protein [Bryobacteraceae bacterium]
MDPAKLGVVLDSSIVIEAERQHLDVARFLKHIAGQLGEREVALSAISVAELAHGVYRADTAVRRQARRAFLDDLKATVPVYPITGETAELVGKINAESSQKGITIPFDDLLIGACALERGYYIATRNERHFRKITGLNLIQL